MKKKQLGYGILILFLGVFALKPILVNSIKKYRYETEIRPIRKGMKEHIKREQQSYPGTRGIIFSLSTYSNPKIFYVPGLPQEKNRSIPYFDLSLKTPSGYKTFSRDTTVGQIVGVLINHHKGVKEEDKNHIYNIYYQPGTAIIDKKINRSVTIMKSYLKDSLYDAVFIANTFDKDSLNKSNLLTKKRLLEIKKELGITRACYYQNITR